MMRFAFLASISALTLIATAAHASPDDFDPEGGLLFDNGSISGPSGPFGPAPAVTFGSSTGKATLVRAFEGINHYDTISLGRGFIPPDTMGAVGTNQYVAMVNGAVAVYSKTGTRLSFGSDDVFWKNAGTTGFGSDPRVQYDKANGRWIAAALNNDFTKLNVAVSATSDATGAWKGATFTGFYGTNGNGIADYPTLAVDDKAVYIGTNNFTSTFKGTTLNVLNKADVFAAGGPIVTSLKQFSTPYTGGASDVDGGFALQGVNRTGGGNNGKVVGASLFDNGLVTFDVNNAGTAGATTSPFLFLADNYTFNRPGRQPNGGAGSRLIDTSGDRTSASVVEVNGRIYATQTVTAVGTDHTLVRVTVIDAATNAVLSRTDIADSTHDFYQGSIAVNSKGQVVVGYNRSGYSLLDGKIRVYARTFNTNADGTLTQRDEVLIVESLTDHYFNGGIESVGPSGRQRWGDYSAVTLDPTNDRSFWVTGEFAREFNVAAAPGFGRSRYSTAIAEVNVGSVPEPASWALFIGGFGVVGAMQRRRRSGYATA